MHTAIFDIGKTNKKFFLFDEQRAACYREYQSFAETTDEDGFPCDDLPAIIRWIQDTLRRLLADGRFNISRLNFSTYGATLVHLDAQGQPVCPLYNYLKPLPTGLSSALYARYGGREQFATETASPALEMLNSGLQLYWLKEKRPRVFARIRHSLHLPQYLSYLFTGQLQSEYTSIGCHTALWDFQRHNYHHWLEAEGLRPLLPPSVPTTTRTTAVVDGHSLAVGPGIHDSSAALLTYLHQSEAPFVLLSTGTWSIALNPFNATPLTPEELQRDCLNFLRTDGQPVKAARLFLGQEYQLQQQMLADHYGSAAVQAVELPGRTVDRPCFRWQSLAVPQAVEQTDLSGLPTYADAYTQLVNEMVDLQLESLQLVLRGAPVKRIYIDGGFSSNTLFVQRLRHRLPDHDIIVADSPLGSALGAALAVQ